MENIIGKTFTRKLDGKTVRVIDQENDIIILEGNTRINRSTLTNSDQFSITENNVSNNMDKDNIPNMNNGFANSLFNSVSGISDTDLNNINDNLPPSMNGPSVKEIGVVESHTESQAKLYEESANNTTNPNKANELKRKAIELQQKAKKELDRQTKLMNKQMGIEEEPFVKGSDININGEIIENNRHIHKTQTQTTTPIQDNNPMTVMFKGFKRTKQFKCKLEINELIPNYDLIRMFEEGYEMSIIDYLTDEILNKVSSDPNMLRNEIKRNLEIAVFGKSKLKTNKSIKQSTSTKPVNIDLRGFKKSKNKEEYIKKIKNKKELLLLANKLKIKTINNKTIRTDIEKEILKIYK